MTDMRVELWQQHGEASPPTRGAGAPRAGVALLAIFGAVVLLALAVPRTVAGLLSTAEPPGGAEAADAGTLQGDLARERIAARVSGDPAAMARVAAIEAALARIDGIDTPAGRERLAAASALLRDSLSRAPARPGAWEQLAYATVVADGPTRAAADAVSLSLLTGYEMPSRVRSRLSLVLSTWGAFRPDDRAGAERLVRDVWRADARLLAAFAVRYRAEDAVRGVLAESGAPLAEFDALLAEARKS